MSVQLLRAEPVERTWGRTALPVGFEAFTTGTPIGELWHRPPKGDADQLLIKHLFSSERLSIQVHPGDEAARAKGLVRGKDEAWFILDAGPDAAIALGPKRAASWGELRDSARTGAIEVLVDWKPVKTGDFIFAPAGTIHAIGGGISLIEIQQNSDVTYRLYDYGRPRELHLDDGLEVARLGPWQDEAEPVQVSDQRTVLLSGQSFVVERWAVDALMRLASAKPLLAIPVAGRGAIDGNEIAPGQVWSAEGLFELRGEGLNLLITYPGKQVTDFAS